MTDLIQQIAGDLKMQMEGFELSFNTSNIGSMIEAGDGIARGHRFVNDICPEQDALVAQFSSN